MDIIIMDFKNKYIVKCTQSLLGLSEQPTQLIQSEKLEQFVTDKKIGALMILYKPGKKLKVALPEDKFPLDPTILMVVVLKMKLQVTSANLTQAYSISLSSADCIKNLATEISRLYLPYCQGKSNNVKNILKTIKSWIGDQELFLDNQESESNLQSVKDQFLFWKRMFDHATSPENKKKALYHTQSYKEISQNWINLQNLTDKQYRELTELTFDALGKVWDQSPYSYNRGRFGKLLTVMTISLWKKLSAPISTISSEIKNDLRVLEETMKFWGNTLKQYKETIWRAKPFDFKLKLQVFDEKIADVRQVVEQFEQIKIMSEKISESIDIKQIEEVFKDTLPLSVNPILQKNWQKAKKRFQYILQSKCHLIISYFKSHVGSISKANSKPFRVLEDLYKWNALLAIPQIHKALAPDHQQIFSIIQTHLQKIKHQFESRTGQSFDPIPNKQSMAKVKNFSPFLCGILWVRQAGDKIRRLHQFCKELFRNCSSYETFKYELNTLDQQMKNYQKDQLQKWISQITDCIYSEGLGVESEGKMIDLDLKNSKLIVNYSQRLILLMREVRQLTELGLKSQIPSEILECSQNGKKLYKEAVSLKKIANFYNNMNEEIIECQKPMILEQLKYFEECVESINSKPKDKASINWDNPTQINSYIKNLNEATNILMKENARLRKIHQNIIDIIIELSNVDLKKNRNVWLTKLEEIKAQVQIACKNKQAKYCRKWKIHCDIQLYKILQLQFLQGLEDSSLLTDINVQIIFKNKMLTLKPNMQDLKDKYYREITNYLMWPSRVFRGILGNLEIYSKLGQRNSLAIKSLINKAENIFSILAAHLRSLDQWNCISYLSLKNIQSAMNTMNDWQFNIRVIRMKRKQLQKIQDYQKIQCFNINHIKLKYTIDQYLADFLESMMNSLKDSVIQQSKQIEQFLTQSLTKLLRKSQSLEDMQKTKNDYLQIKGRQKETKRKIQQILIKKKWILQATGYQHDTNQLEKSWDQFNAKLQDYDTLLAEQIQHLKSKVQQRIDQITNNVTKYESKTSSIILPNSRAQILDTLQTLADYQKQQQQILKQIDLLKKDCEQFQLSIPQLKIKTIDWQPWNILKQYLQVIKPFESQLFIKMKSQKLYAFQDKCLEWHQKVKNLQKTRQVIHIMKQIDLFKSIFTTLRTLASGILQKEHWRSLWTTIKENNVIPSENIKLGDMLNRAKQISEKIQGIQDIVSRAQGQATLRQALQQLAIWWQTAEFEMTVYEGKVNKCHLIKQWKQLTSKVSDNMSLVSSLKESRFVGKFLQQIEMYEKKIGQVERALYSLNGIQRRWVYLEPILIGGALPDQLQRFNKLDLAFRNIMGIIAAKPKLQTLSSMEGIDNSLQTIQEQQQRCQKALNDFLQLKRTKFPRFYFLGDEDLLEILAQTQNPAVIQLHMKKLFAAIHSVGFTADNKFITEIYSIEKQRVSLTRKVQLNENVEVWLNILEQHMFETLEANLRQYVSSDTKQIKITEYPSQILCLMQEIRFSDHLEAAIKSKNIKGLDSQLKQNLQNLTKILPTVGRLESLKLKAIILDLIHHLNIVSQLLKEEKPITTNSYSYKKNFKFTTAPQLYLFGYKYKYTFQYQGNLPKLVHTPLTDKCYITLSLALTLGLGGNPYGPAGTGKTETVKAMAMLFGRMCLVFNCDEGLDYKSMARIFLGLVRCGAWGCFDEFNRLLEQQLSAISQQIQVIQFAIKANQTHLQLIGKKVNVNPNSGIFVTLNPAGKGYGGRSRLPDNLKQLFRPVAMSVPDNELIAEVLLYSQGFKQAKQLASKVICLFNLSKQLLSQQQHYDWGLRALKTILSVAGRLISEERSNSKTELSFQTQSELLIKTIRINTLSKLTFTDINKFKLLLNDIFPGIASKDIVYEELHKVIIQVLQEMKLSVNDAQISKVLQFYEATKQRMGVVIVGPSGCGKTTIWKVLKRCYDRMSIPIKTYLINPKSMPRQQLLGHMNNDTREFNEGVLTVSAREVVKNPGQNWIILDGDIDPEWIESLNSVLDDNHLLTLPTGERINFQQGTCFIFETDSLLYASPATVSRMGMIYLNNEDINIKGVLDKWCHSQPHLKEYFSKVQIQNLLNYQEIVQSTLIGQLNQILSQMSSVESHHQFVAAITRGITANYAGDKHSLINHIFDKLGDKNSFSPKQSLAFYAQGRSFRTYSTLPAEFTLDDILSESGATLQTAMTQSYVGVLRAWVQLNQHFMVVGPQGCGKALIIRQAFSQIRKSMRINFSVVYCNSQTNAYHIIQKLYQICTKANSGAGKILRPKDCARLVLFLKDVNLPKPDKYNTIQLASFLQQVIGHRGFYDPTTLEFVLLDQKIQIVISMLPPTSMGRNQLTQRLTAIMKILTIEYPSNEDLAIIYTQYFKSLLKYNKMTESLAKPISSFFIETYINLKSNFTVDQHRHYSLTPKNLLQIFCNLAKYEISDQDTLLDTITNQFSKNYRNKIVSQQRKAKYDQIINNLLKQHFKYQSKSEHIFTYVSGKYIRVKKEDYLTMIRAAITQYEREYKPITYIPLQECISQISSIEKAITGGDNLLLSGVSGVGRMTTLYLAGLFLKKDIITVSNTRDYGVRQFKKELKSILEVVVNEDKKVILFLEDHNLFKTQFIQMINSLLVSGQIPGLFTLDEIDRMPAAEAIKKQSLGKSLQEAFCDRVKSNLRIVLSLDNQREGFKEMCASNPALFTCNIIWYDTLNNQSLKAIASEILAKALPQFSKATIDQISGLCAETHKSMQQKYKFPQRSFYSLLKNYCKIFNEKSSLKKTEGYHLQKGLQKLEEAKSLVDLLSKQAYDKQKLLAVKETQASKALIEIEKAVTQATKRKNQTQNLSKNLQIEQQKIYTKKQSVEEQLSEVQPLIDEAKKSVKGISSANLSELASLPKPPDAIRIVLKAVTRMFGQTNAEWNSIKNFIKNKSFIDNVINYDPRSITPEMRKDIQTQIEKNSNSFQKNTIYRASLAAGPLADWIKAILRYSKVIQTIKPLETQLNKLLKALDSSKQRVMECQKQIDILDTKTDQLKKVFASKTGQAQVLKNQLKKSEETLTTAKNLISKLEDERIRWDLQFKTIEKQLREYPISSFLAAAFTNYQSAKDQNQRQIILKQWKLRTKLDTFNYLKFMINQGIQLKWKSQGLSSDSLSMENSVMIFNTTQIPLLMDPNNQAIQWLKKSIDSIQVTSQRHQKFSNTLELAVRFGKQLLIQQMDNIESILVPLIRGDVQQQGSRVVIKVGDKVVEYSSQFKLYLATRNTSMELPTNNAAIICLINYSVTKSGLQSKFLSLVINYEKPQLEKKKQQLLQNEDKLKVSLGKLEEQLLAELGTSSGNILENQALLLNLTNTKVQSTTISNSLKDSEQLNANLDAQRQIYRSLAQKGAKIYLLISELHKINNMYRFSLSYFTKLFLGCLESKNKGAKLTLQSNQASKSANDLALAEKQLSKIVFNNVSSSLFKVDRLPFGLFLVKGINPQSISQTQWQFFTGVFPAPLEDKVILPKWALFDRQQSFNTFCVALPKIAKAINFNDTEMQNWYKNPNPEKNMPAIFSKITPFQRILLIQVFRPQKLQSAIINYVCQQLGINSIGGNMQSFQSIVQKQISNKIPVLFIVSTGYDPSKQLEQYCQSVVGRNNYLQLSMGGGQNEAALGLLKQAAEKGQWLCLKNIHLVTSWLPTLEKQFQALEIKHQKFRLFLTSQQHRNFPNVLLETCFKVSYQSPPGLKKNFLRIYQQLQTSSNPTKANFYLLLAFFHSVLSQRRNYIPQGWSKLYEFSYSDLKVSTEIINSIIKEEQETKLFNFQKLYGVFEEGIYGGRIDNPSDLKVLRSYLIKYFNTLTINGESELAFGLNLPRNQKQLNNFLAKIPQIDAPSVFGLPNAIDKVVQRNNAQFTINSLKLLSFLGGQSKNLKKEQWLKLLSPIFKTWGQIYKQIKDSKFPQIKQSQLLSDNPIQSFIYLEATQAIQLLEKINKGVTLMENILQGKGLMNNQIQKLLMDLLERRIPKDWEQFWPQCDEPLQWIRKFGRKIILLKNWVIKVQSSRLNSQQFDLAQLFHPAVFMNACKQAAARNQIALDKLSIVATFEQNKATQNSIKLKGLLLQGCSYVKGLLSDGGDNQEEYECLPVLYIDFLSNPPPLYPNMEQFCLFSSGKRETIIIKLNLGINGKNAEKIIAGSALMLREV